ncbi:MAG: M23 family metallopeptidase [Gorillibacterium sp.]|nr:M23 family metallopeptidase [Gorillibacterium sp.]
METKGNVRRRRKERLRELTEQSNLSIQTTDAGSPETSRYKNNRQGRTYELRDSEGHMLREEGYPLYTRNGLERDPEQVWKEKEQTMFSKSILGRELVNTPDIDKGQARGPGRIFRLQLTASLLIFVLLWGLFHYPRPTTAPARQEVASVMMKEWNFAAVSTWYQSKFGTIPSFLPTFRSKKAPEAEPAGAKRATPLNLPARSAIVSVFSPSHPWLELSTVVGTPVSAMDAGLVSFVGKQEGVGYTVTIRHMGGIESTYGLLDPIRLAQGDWVKIGETIGMATRNAATGKGAFSFAIAKDGDYVNPAEWIPFD